MSYRLSAFLVLLAGCAASPALREHDIRTATFAPALDVDLGAMMHSPSGLYYVDLSVGQGDAARPGSRLTVRYVGWLPDGTVFDTSDPKPSVIVRLNSSLIAGWVEGLQGIKPGGTRQLVVPPQLGYGDQRVGNIPPESILVFVVTVLAVD